MGRLSMFLRNRTKTVLLIVSVASITVVATSLAAMWLNNMTNLRIPNLGTITTLGVEAYWDEGLTNKTEGIKWTTIWPGASQNVTVYLKSTSNIETTLTETTGNWTFWNSKNEVVAGPSSSTPYMYLTWDYDNSTVRQGETRQVTLTLHAISSSDFREFLVSKDVQTFSFDIHIQTASPG